MKTSNKVLLSLLSLVLVSVFAFSFMGQSPSSNDDFSTSITYHSNVCVQKNNEPAECDHNLLYDTGKELIETYLGDTGGSTDEVDQISLCDSDIACGTPQADAAEAFNTITNRGLAEATGTYASVGTGNWTITNTFTATGSVSTDTTRLQNTAGVNFAGNEFTEVSLENGDQLTIAWNIWVA